MTALTIPGVEVGAWTIRNRADAAAIWLANRHYSREVVTWKQVGGPSFLLVLVTPCERAVWLTSRHSPEATTPRAVADGLNAFRCAMFRNEGAGLSSALIREAVALTEAQWGTAPADGWVTYVRSDAVASPNPGYCFKRAGWTLDRDFTSRRYVRLRLN